MSTTNVAECIVVGIIIVLIIVRYVLKRVSKNNEENEALTQVLNSLETISNVALDFADDMLNDIEAVKSNNMTKEEFTNYMTEQVTDYIITYIKDNATDLDIDPIIINLINRQDIVDMVSGILTNHGYNDTIDAVYNKIEQDTATEE